MIVYACVIEYYIKILFSNPEGILDFDEPEIYFWILHSTPELFSVGNFICVSDFSDGKFNFLDVSSRLRDSTK
jgi:hypothetical protein